MDRHSGRHPPDREVCPGLRGATAATMAAGSTPVPEARMDDGILHTILVRAVPRHVFARSFRPTPPDSGGNSPRIWSRSSRPGNHDFRPSPLHYLPGRGMFSLAGGPAGSVPAQGKFLWSQGMQPQRHRTRQYLREHLQILHNFSPNTPFTNPGECTMIAALALERVEC